MTFQTQRSPKEHFERLQNCPNSSSSLKAHIPPKPCGLHLKNSPSIQAAVSSLLYPHSYHHPRFTAIASSLVASFSLGLRSILHPEPENHLKTEARCCTSSSQSPSDSLALSDQEPKPHLTPSLASPYSLDLDGPDSLPTQGHCTCPLICL